MPDDVEVFDPTEVQLRALQEQQTYTFRAEDLANSTGVTLLLQQRYVDLTELKSLKRDLEKLRLDTQQLTKERDVLQIEVTRLQERNHIALAEIIVGGILGYALSLVPTDPRTGIVLVLLSVALLLIMKMAEIAKAVENITGKGRQNASEKGN